MLEAEFVECMELAGKESDPGFVIEGNTLKRKSD